MSASTDVVILGSGFRGLWLASELVKLGWSVTWYQIHKPIKSTGDDWPWQIGPKLEKSQFINATRDFVEEVFKPKPQDIAVQVLTLEGPLELSGPASMAGLRKFFPKSFKELKSYFEVIQNAKLLGAQTNKIFKRPLGERWILEWLGTLRRTRQMDIPEWVNTWDGEILDPSSQFLLLEDSLSDVVERGINWAEKRGVRVKRDAVVSDIGVEGRLATGIEVLGGGGYSECKRIILACSHQAALKAVPRFAQHLEPHIKLNSEVFVWSRCGFLLKAGTKPSGLCEFSSFVIDPFMPLVGNNMGLLKWSEGAKGDSLTVWSRIPYGELKRRSYLMNLAEDIEKQLGKLFPWFSKRTLAVFPFEEYFHSPESGHDDLPLVFSNKNKFIPATSRLKNVMLLGPGLDRGLELLSQIATEYRLLSKLEEIRKKELKRDRTLHPPRNGQDLVQSK